MKQMIKLAMVVGPDKGRRLDAVAVTPVYWSA